MNLTVLGAGAWGTALAVHAARAHPTRLWARDAAQAAQIQTERCNTRYLPGIALPTTVEVTSDFDAAVGHAADGLLLVATPTAALDEMLRRLAPSFPSGVLWLCKGFEEGSGALGHEIAARACPGVPVGMLSGPSFALEVARGQPTALVVASTDAALRQRALDALHADGLRLYTSADPVGVEIGGAVKNVLAIATGIADGMGLGLNARAALITRGLAEMTRLGVALGAQPETFTGLSGLGDLVLTATGELSRNRRVGLLLAAGLPLVRILAELGHVAEGVRSAAVVQRRAEASGVEMPITAAVVAVISGALTPAAALHRLLGRDARPEA